MTTPPKLYNIKRKKLNGFGANRHWSYLCRGKKQKYSWESNSDGKERILALSMKEARMLLAWFSRQPGPKTDYKLVRA